MAGFVFNRGALGLLSPDASDILWTGDTIKARLSRTSESLNKDSTVMTGLGLSATDMALAGMAGPTEDQALDRIKYTATDPTFVAVAAGAEIDKLIVFKFVTNDADSIPIANVNITAITPNGGDIAVTWDSAGVFYLQE